MNHSFVTLLAAGLVATSGLAQDFRVVPSGYDQLEGTSASRTPLGWTNSRIQYLIDSSEICNNRAILTGLSLRLDGGNFNIDAPVAQSLQVTIDAYEVPIGTDQMSRDWTVNVQGVTPQRVFNGTLNVPAAFRIWPYPNPWSVGVTFDTPLLHNRANGNLLLDWNVSGGTGNNWPVDAMFLIGGEARGEITRIWAEDLCVSSAGDVLEVTLPTSGNNGTIGLPIRVDYTGTTAVGRTMDFVYHAIGLSKDVVAPGVPSPVGLGVFGAPDCLWTIEPLATQTSTTQSGSFGWPVPFDTTLIGAAVFLQSFGFVSATSTVVPAKEAWQVRLGSDQPRSSGPLQMVHRSNYTGQAEGFLSPSGYYGMVVRFEGVFN